MAEARARILVVDDDPDIRGLLRRWLMTKYEVDVAGDGQQALSAIAQLRPDLLITDRMMPHLDGIGLVETLRSRPDTAALPIIMLTALNASNDKESGFEAGADDFLGKPFEPPELLARVRSLLRRASLVSPGTNPLSIPHDATAYIAGLTLFSVLQMLHLDRKTCDLHVNAGHGTGVLAIADGDLVGAADAVGEGEGAAYRILGWHDARITIQEASPDRSHTITVSLPHILMEAMRLQDEAAAEP